MILKDSGVFVQYFDQFGVWHNFTNAMNNTDTLNRQVTWLEGWGFPWRISLPLLTSNNSDV